jgi:uncharacterized membrane-anchored protein
VAGYWNLTAGDRVRRCSCIVSIVIGWRLGANAVLSFWLAYILTRPLGANLGDWLGLPTADHGLGLGTAITSAIFRDPRYGRVPHAHPQRRVRRHELTLRAACGGGRR